MYPDLSQYINRYTHSIPIVVIKNRKITLDLSIVRIPAIGIFVRSHKVSTQHTLHTAGELAVILIARSAIDHYTIHNT